MNHGLTENKTIAVDVDGTLINVFGDLNEAVKKYCIARKADGYTLVLWSARGKEYAERYADQYGIANLFDVIMSKPGAILDDNGWAWIKYVKWVREL